MFTPPKENSQMLSELLRVIDDGIVGKRAEQPRRQYLGASRIGEACWRMLAYDYHGIPKDADAGFDGKTLRIFDMGHDGEARMAEYLRLAGFNLQTHKDDGKQIGISDCDGKFKGHLDGVLHGGPAIPGLKYPALWENKELGDKNWKDFQKNGLEDSKPVYYAQVQIYMGYYELENTLFTAKNKNTCEIHAEIVPFDAGKCQPLIEKAARITSSTNPEEFGRLGREPSDFVCKFCDYRMRCWGLVEPKPASETDKPAWRK